MKKIIFTLALITTALSQPQFQVTGTMPVPVYGAKAVAVDSLIYVLGGYLDSINANVKIIQAYNPKDGTWQIVDEMKAERYGLAAVNHEGNIFYSGGILNGQPHGNKMEEWDLPLSPDFYDTKNNFTRTFPACELKDGKIYTFGGSSTTISAAYMYEYDIASSTITYSNNFTFVGIFPSQQMSALAGNNIYLFGGSSLIGVSRTIYNFDIQARTLTPAPEMLSPSRAGGEAVRVDDKIYIMGGYSETQPVLSSVEVYNLSEQGNSINPGPSLNHARKEFMAVEWEGKIYVMGGKDANNNPVAQVEKLDLTTSVPGDNGKHPENFKLYDNYPNPFNPLTNIEFRISDFGFVTLKIFDLLGNEIVTLVNEVKQPGKYEAQFNGLNKDGSRLTSGVYFYRLEVRPENQSAAYFSEIKKMILIK